MFDPTKHYCPDWDYALIKAGDPEFGSCLCRDIEKLDFDGDDEDSLEA